jgi:hypothetical protein
MATLELNSYQEFFVANQPSIKAENPSWTPQQVTTEIGKRWTLQKLTINEENGNVCINHAKRKIIIDACGFPSTLILYLDSYKRKHGGEALVKLAELMKMH